MRRDETYAAKDAVKSPIVAKDIAESLGPVAGKVVASTVEV